MKREQRSPSLPDELPLQRCPRRIVARRTRTLGGHSKPMVSLTAQAPAATTAKPNVLSAEDTTELNNIWKADPRIPSLDSRRLWAAARGVEPAQVHAWFSHKKYHWYKAKGKKPTTGTYELPVGIVRTVPVSEDVGTVEDARTQVKAVQVKRERASPVLHEGRGMKRRKVDKGHTQSKVPTGYVVKSDPRILENLEPLPPAVRHTRAHDANPNPSCATCASRFLSSMDSPNLFSPSPRTSRMQTPELTRSPVLPSSDFDFTSPLTHISSEGEQGAVVTSSSPRGSPSAPYTLPASPGTVKLTEDTKKRAYTRVPGLNSLIAASQSTFMPAYTHVSELFRPSSSAHVPPRQKRKRALFAEDQTNIMRVAYTAVQPVASKLGSENTNSNCGSTASSQSITSNTLGLIFDGTSHAVPGPSFSSVLCVSAEQRDAAAPDQDLVRQTTISGPHLQVATSSTSFATCLERGTTESAQNAPQPQSPPTARRLKHAYILSAAHAGASNQVSSPALTSASNLTSITAWVLPEARQTSDPSAFTKSPRVLASASLIDPPAPTFATASGSDDRHTNVGGTRPPKSVFSPHATAGSRIQGNTLRPYVPIAPRPSTHILALNIPNRPHEIIPLPTPASTHFSVLPALDAQLSLERPAMVSPSLTSFRIGNQFVLYTPKPQTAKQRTTRPPAASKPPSASSARMQTQQCRKAKAQEQAALHIPGPYHTKIAPTSEPLLEMSVRVRVQERRKQRARERNGEIANCSQVKPQNVEVKAAVVEKTRKKTKQARHQRRLLDVVLSGRSVVKIEEEEVSVTFTRAEEEGSSDDKPPAVAFHRTDTKPDVMPVSVQTPNVTRSTACPIPVAAIRSSEPQLDSNGTTTKILADPAKAPKEAEMDIAKQSTNTTQKKQRTRTRTNANAVKLEQSEIIMKGTSKSELTSLDLRAGASGKIPADSPDSKSERAVAPSSGKTRVSLASSRRSPVASIIPSAISAPKSEDKQPDLGLDILDPDTLTRILTAPSNHPPRPIAYSMPAQALFAELKWDGIENMELSAISWLAAMGPADAGPSLWSKLGETDGTQVLFAPPVPVPAVPLEHEALAHLYADLDMAAWPREVLGVPDKVLPEWLEISERASQDVGLVLQ